MSGYGDFSCVYDILTEDVDYKGRGEYLFGLFNRFDRTPTLMLDLACGTGSFSNEFAKRGIDVIGVDASESMLSVARKKSEEQGNNILYLCQNADELELYGTVDGAICCLDSVNHIIDKEELQRAFCKVSLFLEPQRLIIFDVNTLYKHKNILGNETFVIEDDRVFCTWRNNFLEDDNITEINLDIFVEQGGVYKRYSEDFCERAYSHKELEEILSVAGLKIEAVLDDMSYEDSTPASERVIYVTRKV